MFLKILAFLFPSYLLLYFYGSCVSFLVSFALLFRRYSSSFFSFYVSISFFYLYFYSFSMLVSLFIMDHLRNSYKTSIYNVVFFLIVPYNPPKY